MSGWQYHKRLFIFHILVLHNSFVVRTWSNAGLVHLSGWSTTREDATAAATQTGFTVHRNTNFTNIFVNLNSQCEYWHWGYKPWCLERFSREEMSQGFGILKTGWNWFTGFTRYTKFLSHPYIIYRMPSNICASLCSFNIKTQHQQVSMHN